MDRLTLELQTFDVAAPEAGTTDAFADLVARRVVAAWDDGADVVVLPELLWVGLSRFADSPDGTRALADLFWGRLWPALQRTLLRPGKAAVLGTVPWAEPDGTLRNRAPIVSDGKVLHQDKINLTPWESSLRGGDVLRIWDFGGVRCAVVICLDIEVPELSVALRGKAVDLLLVPSATESILGVERVGRCADARAVELCCHVGLAHLVGDINSSLVDANVGRLGVFSPSQSAFGGSPRQRVSEVVSSGFHRLRAELDIAALRRQRDLALETNPARLRPGALRLDG
jgi:predicted amidohydrolase